MDVEKLTMDLRPRPHWQAVDLGFALLRSRAGSVYAAWWAVWSGIVVVSCVCAWFWPTLMGVWLVFPWFVRPALERLVVHILSRAVFSEEMTWKEALGAWKSTLDGGMIRVLTWWRLWALGRSFLQPIWQLEGVRGDLASRRREALSRKGAGKTAMMWGLACVHIEFVLWMALLTFEGLFTPDGSGGNPFGFLFHSMGGDPNSVNAVCGVLCYGIALGLVGPFYAACGFTLYLNRRAELEAWDIELALRKLCRRIPAAGRGSPFGTIQKTTSRIMPVVFLLALFSASALAATPKINVDSCQPPKWWNDPAKTRTPTQDSARIALRKSLDSIYRAQSDLQTWTCEETWVAKDTTTKIDSSSNAYLKQLGDALRLIGHFIDRHANAIVWAIIFTALALVFWIAWKYRDMVDLGAAPKRASDPPPPPRVSPAPPPPVFPSDPTDMVLSLWTSGKSREALSVLYRHVCSRTTENGARLPKGFSEGALQKVVKQWRSQGKTPAAEADLMLATIRVWSDAAWADKWPDTDRVSKICQDWKALLTKKGDAL